MKVVLKFIEKKSESDFDKKIRWMGLNPSEVTPNPELICDNFYVERRYAEKRIGTANSEIRINFRKQTITLLGARHSLHFSDITEYFKEVLLEKENLFAVEYETATPSYAWWEVDCAPRESDIAKAQHELDEIREVHEKKTKEVNGMIFNHNMSKISKRYGDFFIVYDIFDNAVVNDNDNDEDETYQCDIREALESLFEYEELGKFLENLDSEGVSQPLTDEQIEKIDGSLQDAVTESFCKRSDRYIKWLASKETKPTTWDELERMAQEDGLFIGRDYIDEDAGVLEYNNDGHCFLETFYAHGIERARFNSLRDAGKTDQEALEIIIGF